MQLHDKFSSTRVVARRWSHYDRNASCVNANFAQLCSRRRSGRLFMQCVDIFHIKEREPSSSFRIFRKIMGINTLLPFVKEATTKMNIKDFAGQVCAVDASCWLHKALAVSYKEFGDDRRFV